MNPVRIFQPRNRLAEIVSRAEGSIPIATALQRATDNIEQHRDDCVRAIDEAIESLQSALPSIDKPPAAALSHLYELSNEIVAVAATMDLRDVSRAAYSLCELLDRYRGNGGWSRRSVIVHIEALRLLRAPGHDAAGRAAIIAGLDQILHVTAR